MCVPVYVAQCVSKVIWPALERKQPVPTTWEQQTKEKAKATELSMSADEEEGMASSEGKGEGRARNYKQLGMGPLEQKFMEAWAASPYVDKYATFK
jgi:hypothetical protein